MKVDKIKVNFFDEYYMFYDWLNCDNIKLINKPVLCKVNSKIVNDLIAYKIKTEFKNQIVLFSDSYTYIVIKFDEKGISKLKSSLLLEDEEKMDKQFQKQKFENISYQIVDKKNDVLDLRINNVVKNTLQKELKNLIETNNVDKLSYLYYEWFNKSAKSVEQMLKDMQRKINYPVTLNEINIYNLIKKSYKTV